MHFQWIALKYFREVVHARSIRKAAERLHVAPSALNRQIIKLEEQIGCQLFERCADGVRPTSAGDVFHQYVLKAQNDLARALSEIDELRRIRRGHVSLTCEEGLAKDLLPGLIVGYREHHPHVTFAVRVRDMEGVVEEVGDGSADIGIAFNPIRDPRVRRHGEVAVAIGAVMRPDHALAAQPVLRLADLMSEPLILPDAGYSLRHLFDGQFDGSGDSLFFRVAETTSFEAMTAMVKAGLGIGIRSRVGIRGEIARGEVAFVPVVERSFHNESVVAMVKARRTLPVAAAVFADRLAGALSSLGDAGEQPWPEPAMEGLLRAVSGARAEAHPTSLRAVP